jgi:hypothetical protein
MTKWSSDRLEMTNQTTAKALDANAWRMLYIVLELLESALLTLQLLRELLENTYNVCKRRLWLLQWRL